MFLFFYLKSNFSATYSHSTILVKGGTSIIYLSHGSLNPCASRSLTGRADSTSRLNSAKKHFLCFLPYLATMLGALTNRQIAYTCSS